LIFNSVTYLLFLAAVVPLYWLLPRRARLWMTFAASLVFYGFWRVEFVPLMLLSALVDYFAALGIDATEDPRRRKLYLAASLTVNFGLLFIFKYLMFATENAFGLLNLLGFDVEPPRFSIVLPLGISFYTFQTVSYTIDVYRRFIRPERDFILYGCYVTFFPQLVAGPILRASELLPQLDRRPRFSLQDFTRGLERLACGLFLKVVFADNFAETVDLGFAQSVASLGALDVWTLAFLFGLQIYFDFSAYSHIALGCARMMGVRLPENFDFPYLAPSPREFWRRWHISLSSWVRDYLYLPLAGEAVSDTSRGGLAVAGREGRRGRRDRALFVSWAIMGLWHGANWTFVLWGLHHAVLVFAQRRLGPRFAHWPAGLRGVAGWAVTLPLVMLSWIWFRAPTLGDALAMFGTILVPTNYSTLGLRLNTYLAAAMYTGFVIVSWAAWNHLLPRVLTRPAPRFAAYATAFTVIFALVLVFLRPIQQFIYFQF
jgi:D-alanyl-lipoteichoic acid acyltransferase DltB (MBOAT superfamily)